MRCPNCAGHGFVTVPAPVRQGRPVGPTMARCRRCEGRRHIDAPPAAPPPAESTRPTVCPDCRRRRATVHDVDGVARCDRCASWARHPSAQAAAAPRPDTDDGAQVHDLDARREQRGAR